MDLYLDFKNDPEIPSAQFYMAGYRLVPVVLPPSCVSKYMWQVGVVVEATGHWCRRRRLRKG